MASVQDDSLDTRLEQEDDTTPQLRKSCDYCVRMKRGCDGGTPCALCKRRSKECMRSVKKRSGPAKGTKYCKRRARKGPNILKSLSFPRASKGSSGSGKKPSAPSASRRALPASAQGSKNGVRSRIPPSKPVSIVRIKREAPGMPPAASVVPPERSATPIVDASRATVPSAKRRAIEVGPAVPFEAPQARWGQHRPKVADLSITGDRSSYETDTCGGGVSLPFYFSPSEIGVGPDDAPSSDVSVSTATGAGSSSGGQAQHAARTVASRRGSLEDALFGSCYKRHSFNSWTPLSFHSQPQAMEIGGRDVAGLLWNHEVHTYGDEGTGTTSLAVGRGPEHLPPPVSTGFFQAAGFGISEPQRVAPPPPVTMTFDTAGGAAAGAAPSLRDLLFDKWPPAPLNELSMAEPLV